MKFETHNTSSVNIGGTSLAGNLTANYYDLVAVFGEPHYDEGYKTDAGWDIEFRDGTVASIYNWKNGKNYCGNEGETTEEITDWNVGGFNARAVTLITQALSLGMKSESTEEVEPDIKLLLKIKELLEVGHDDEALDLINEKLAG